MRILNVAEKPSVAKSIANILSEGFYQRKAGLNKFCNNFYFEVQKNNQTHEMIITSVLGHLKTVDFTRAYKNWNNCNPRDLLTASIETKTPNEMIQIHNNIQNLARISSVIIIWTDCDREGEFIGKEIEETCQEVNRNIQTQRARYSSITKEEIFKAFLNTGKLDMKSVNAVSCRIEIDLRIGSALTRHQTLGLQNKINLPTKIVSYGPCQFPTLGFIVEQYNRVNQFVSEVFWYIEVIIQHKRKKSVLKWERGRLFDFLSCFVLFSKCIEEKEAVVILKETKKTQKLRPLPLRTVDFQKKAASIFKMSSKKIMEITEKLYNDGYVSYPRTETDKFSPSIDLKKLVEKQQGNPLWGDYAKKLLNENKFCFPRNGRNDDQAHPPIHPTKEGNSLFGENKKIYEFITRRFLACCSKNAEGLETNIIFQINNEKFSLKGIEITEKGYLDVYIYEKWIENELPSFEKGSIVVPQSIRMESGRTTAPRLLTESDLINTMDKNGIGTDATIHEHIQKVIERFYAVKQKDLTLKPTTLGIGLVKGYDLIGLDFSLTKPYLRAEMEFLLNEICHGKITKENVTTNIIKKFDKAYVTVEKKFDTLLKTISELVSTGEPEPPSIPKAPKRKKKFK